MTWLIHILPSLYTLVGCVDIYKEIYDLIWNSLHPQEEPIPENLNHVMTDVEVAQSVEQAIAALDIVSF